MNKEQTMEERFDKEFEETNEQLYCQYGEALNLRKVKDFINSEIDLALKSQQERLVGEIEKKIDTMYKCEGITGDYILALKEALEIIKKTYGNV